MNEQLILSHHSKNPQFLSMTPNADLRKLPAQSTKQRFLAATQDSKVLT
jgi:hypothetical protein